MHYPQETPVLSRPNLRFLPNAGTSSGIRGLVVVDEFGQLVATLGVGADPRIEALVASPRWLEAALAKRILPILLGDRKLVAHIAKISGGHFVLLTEGASEAVLRFFLSVDFAYDIIDHVLTDPYAAMVVIDANEKLAFIPPVHEKFFGLQAGEGIGKDVRAVIENTRLTHVLKTGVAEVG